jgi:hypothetical protein
LSKSFGEPRALVDKTLFEKLHAKKNFEGMLSLVKTQMGLDLRIVMGKVNSGGPIHAPAWLKRPEPLPMYGTRAFRETTVTIYLRKEFLSKARCGSIVVAMAHECAHLVLDSIGHPLRELEVVVDLTAMFLGYRMFYLRDAEYVTFDTVESAPTYGLMELLERMFSFSKEDIEVRFTSHTYGYLSREERVYAATLMRT